MRQMTLWEYLGQEVSGIRGAILDAMRRAAEEEKAYGVRIFPVIPADMIMFVEKDEYVRHASTYRRHMSDMAKQGIIERVSERKGYKLAA